MGINIVVKLLKIKYYEYEYKNSRQIPFLEKMTSVPTVFHPLKHTTQQKDGIHFSF